MTLSDRDLRTASDVLAEILAERARQNERWREQNHPDGTGTSTFDRPGPARGHFWGILAQAAQEDCEAATAAGTLTWLDILREEVYEAFAEDDPAKLRAELIQVAAVACQWVEAIDRRQS